MAAVRWERLGRLNFFPATTRDRIRAAQALAEGPAIVSIDKAFAGFGVEVVW